MKNSSLISILESFSSKEIKEFGEFLSSPFFNKNEAVIKLYGYLRKCYPDFDSDKLTKEEIHKNIYPGTKYNDGFMRKTIFNLVRLAEIYITYNKFRGDSISSGIELLDELNSRNLGKLFIKHFSEITDEVGKSKNKDFAFYNRKFKLETSYTRYIDNIRYKVDLHDKKEHHNEHLKEKLYYFTNYFLMQSLNMYRVLKYQSYTDKFEFNHELLDNTADFLIDMLDSGDNKESWCDLNNLAIKVHLYEIMLMRNKSSNENLSKDTYYKKLKDILKNETENLPHDLRFSLYNILTQHSTTKILAGFNEYWKQRWELDKIALEQDIYMSKAEKQFPPPAFASIVRNAAAAKEFEWANSFIEKYKDQLDKDNFDTTMNLSYANIYFNKGDHEKALVYLNKIKPVKRWEFKFAVKELTLQIFYELSMFEQAHYLIDSFRHFLSSMTKNFSLERTESRNNFLKYYTVLLKMKENSASKGLEPILKDLNKRELLIFNRGWLMEKTEELETKKP